MLGSLVTINDPKDARIVTTLQVRNVRITVTRQKAEVMFELYDPKQPIEQFNANLAVPTRPIHDTVYTRFKFRYLDKRHFLSISF